MIHLDTNFIIRGLVMGTDEDRQLRKWLAAGEPLGTSSIAWAEFSCGPLDPLIASSAATLLPNAEPFLQSDASLAAKLFNSGGRRKGSLLDCMIAAVAIRSGATLATSNLSDFARFQSSGLNVVTV
jgi:predicted nucleic acid-binding protein